MKRRWPNALALGAVAGVALLSWGCRAQPAEVATRDDPQTLDSPTPLWRGNGWAVEPEPELEIGVGEGPVEQMLYVAQSVIRLSKYADSLPPK